MVHLNRPFDNRVARGVTVELADSSSPRPCLSMTTNPARQERKSS